MARLDWERWRERLRAADADPATLRVALLDLFFAAGQGVREQAVALPSGDALCLTTHLGPAAAQPACDAVVVDVVSLQLAGQPATAWPQGWRGLGGAPALTATLQLLAGAAEASPTRPTRLRYVRVPAAGATDYLGDLFASGAAELHVLQARDVAAAPSPSLCGVVATASRARNIWRFPACDHALALQVDGSSAETWSGFRRWHAELPTSIASTVHDLEVLPLPGRRERLRAVVRSSAPLALPPPETAGLRWQATAVGTEQRLLFPIGDVMAAMAQLPDEVAGWLQGGLDRPLAAQSLPDGMVFAAHAPHAPSDALWQRLDEGTRSGSLVWSWSVAPIATERPACTANGRQAGPVAVAAGVPERAQVWCGEAESHPLETRWPFLLHGKVTP